MIDGAGIGELGARQAFDASRELVVGRATHQVVPADLNFDSFRAFSC